jgi:hypothetical protein
MVIVNKLIKNLFDDQKVFFVNFCVRPKFIKFMRHEVGFQKQRHLLHE